MDLLSAATACALFFPQPATCPKPPSEAVVADTTLAPWQGYIREAAHRFALPANWISRVMLAESGGHLTLHGKPITSSKGAMGLMQLMPDTWQAMRQKLGLGADPYDPHNNTLAGAAYLRMLWEEFGSEGMFAAYNAGPSRYRAYLAGTKRLPAETEAYLARITDSLPSRASKEPSDALRGNSYDLFVPLSKPLP
jgi:soluble lytic murein transglycosylase-like protein